MPFSDEMSVAVETDRPARRAEQAQDHLPDRRLSAAALSDERDDLALPHLEAHVPNRLELPAAERAHAVRLAAHVEREHQAAFQHAAA